MRTGIEKLERKVLINKYGKILWLMRQRPEHAANWLAGIFLPPHERLWLRNFFASYRENNIVASRGTSKSFSHASLAAPLKAFLTKNLKELVLSASGFRGGQELFEDVDRLFKGQLASQDQSGGHLSAGLTDTKKPIRRRPSMWSLELTSNARYVTLPTNNQSALRGFRAHIGLIDERNTFDGDVVKTVVRPMLNVGQDFRRPAKAGDANQMFQFSTISYTVSDWWPEIQHARDMVKIEYDAMQAIKNGNWNDYKRLMAEKDGALRGASFSYSQVDYTDLILPEVLETEDGRRFTVNFPRESGTEKEDILKYDPFDETSYYFFYPVDKNQLEEPLRSGVMDDELWMAEQRNVPIASSGTVFPYELVQRISERPVYQAGEIPGYPDIENEWYVPILYRCGDPCVLGVDLGRESDKTTFLIIRLGELGEGDFDPTLTRFDEKNRPVLGYTDWNAIIWAEEHSNMQSHDVGEKVRELLERYNIVHTELAGGLGMDKRGGGGQVRDELGNPKPPIRDDGSIDPSWNQNNVIKIYDPEDEEGFAHYAASYPNDPKYWSGLRLLATDNNDNADWTFTARGMMEKKKLYIAYTYTSMQRLAFERGFTTPEGKVDRANQELQNLQLGWMGLSRLKKQLIKLQIERTLAGKHLKFVVPGNTKSEENKKDLYSAMIYAVAMAREHLREETIDEGETPMTPPILAQIGKNYSGQRSKIGGDWAAIV